ncbi:MAG: hypothetical protein RLZZ450_1894 [Pseudomonadota bacterium]
MDNDPFDRANAPDALTASPAHDIEGRAARGGLVVAVAQVARGALEAVGLLVLSRTLLPADFGLVDMIVSVTGIVDQLKDFGLGTALIQRPTITHKQVNTLFWISLAIGFALTLLTALLAPLLAWGYGRPELLELTLALSLSTVLGAVSLQQQALLRRELRFGALSIIDVASAGIGIGCAILAAVRGFGPWALVVRQLVRLAVQAIMTWFWSGFRPSAPTRNGDVAELLRFGGHMSGFQVLNYMERNLDNILIGRFAGAQPLAFYAKAYELMRLPLTAINAPIASVAVPALSRLIDAPERYRSAYLSVTRLLLLSTVPLAPLMIFGADVLIPLILGENWRPSVPIFKVLALALVVKPLLFTASWLFISQGRSAEMFRWGVVGSSIALVSFCVGLPWGAFGVAISFTAFDVLLRAPILIGWVGRRGPVGVAQLLACLWPAWTAGGAMWLAFWLCQQFLPSSSPALHYATSAPLAVVAGALAVWLTPWGKSALLDGVRVLRALRSKPAA